MNNTVEFIEFIAFVLTIPEVDMFLAGVFLLGAVERLADGREALADIGAAVFLNSPADLRRLIADETEKWGKVIRAANIKAD
jgi:hypothetical protein